MAMHSWQFLSFALLFVVSFRLAPDVTWRSAILLSASLFYVSTFLRSPYDGIPLVAFVAVAYALIEWNRRRVDLRIMMASALFLVALFAWLKQYAFASTLPSLSFTYTTIGLSYILFRTIQLVVDAGQGMMPGRISAVGYANFMLNFLTFLSGPIDRFQTFSDNLRSIKSPQRPEVYAALERIVAGYARIIIVSGAAYYLFENLRPLIPTTADKSWATLLVVVCACVTCFTVYLYYNFAGYMDVVIGIGTLAGLRLPENFAKPFSAQSMLEFWNRWHMTLSNWFKLYLFNPLLQWMMTCWPSASAAQWLGVMAYFIVFIVMGLWHGSTSIFFLYGLLLGAGAAGNKLWQIALTSRLGTKRYRARSSSIAYRSLAQGLTAAYFAFALTAFWITTPELSVLSHKFGISGAIATIISLTLAWAAISAIREFVAKHLNVSAPWIKRYSHGPVTVHLRLAFVVLGCLAAQAMLNRSPDFVYADF
jgi:alginate O-acetyltransferase complex protein AlgI